MASKIPWTDSTWNPVVGCTKCSPGCLNCYAEKMAARLTCMGIDPYHLTVTQMPHRADPLVPMSRGEHKWVYEWTGDVICIEDRLDKPLHWRKPRRIFVCSMSDLFHPKVPFEFIDKVFDNAIIAEHRHNHIFQILTKRIKRMAEYLSINKGLPTIPNFHYGVTGCTQAEADEKIPILLQIPAAVRFISIEPMLEGIDIRPYMTRRNWKAAASIVGREFIELDWVIVGAESGPNRRECKIEWVESIVSQCKAAGVKVFVKQIHKNGKIVKMPKEFPQEYALIAKETK